MVLVIAAALLAVVLLVALVSTARSADRTLSRRGRLPRDERLPAGADAALWSIVEAVPDPRNHLALTRDLTGEVRIAGTILDTSTPAAALGDRDDRNGHGAIDVDVDIEVHHAPDVRPVVNTLTPPPPPTPAGGASVRIIGRMLDPVDEDPGEDRPLDVAS